MCIHTCICIPIHLWMHKYLQVISNNNQIFLLRKGSGLELPTFHITIDFTREAQVLSSCIVVWNTERKRWIVHVKRQQKISEVSVSNWWWPVGITPRQWLRTVVLWVERTAVLCDSTVPSIARAPGRMLWVWALVRAVLLLTSLLVPPPPASPLSNQSESRFPQLVRNLCAGIPQSWSLGHAAMKPLGFQLQGNPTHPPWKSMTIVPVRSSTNHLEQRYWTSRFREENCPFLSCQGKWAAGEEPGGTCG